MLTDLFIIEIILRCLIYIIIQFYVYVTLQKLSPFIFVKKLREERQYVYVTFQLNSNVNNIKKLNVFHKIKSSTIQ